MMNKQLYALIALLLMFTPLSMRAQCDVITLTGGAGVVSVGNITCDWVTVQLFDQNYQLVGTEQRINAPSGTSTATAGTYGLIKIRAYKASNPWGSVCEKNFNDIVITPSGGLCVTSGSIGKICNADGTVTLTNIADAGGTSIGAIEYRWISADNCNWTNMVVLSSTSNTVTVPSPTAAPIVYKREARRAGCVDWIATDCLQLSVGECNVVNNPPVATNDNATTPQNTPVTINVLSNDNLNGGSGATLSIVSQSLNGTASVVNGQIVFTPTTSFTGTTTFTYLITASNGTSNTATVTVVVPQGNTGTDICSDPVRNIIAGSGNITISGITSSAAIVQIFNSSWTSVYNQQISTSTVTVPSLPAGTYSVKVSVLNTGGQWPLICEKIIEVTVGAAASNPPVATDDNATTIQDTPVTISVLTNDNLNGGSNASLSIISQSPNGTATVVGNQIIFSPNTGFSGITSFTYKITASNGTSNIATVTVTVPAAVANPPVAANDNATTPQNTPVTINVLSNDNLNGGTGATVSIVSQSLNGTASVVNGQIVFTPTTSFTGTTTFTYKITASNGTSNTATVTVVVPQGNTVSDICSDPVSNIIGGSGNITISGITSAAAIVQIFNSSWASVYNQQISTSTLTVPSLPAGTYNVKVSVLNTGGQWPLICEKIIEVTVGAASNPPVATNDNATTPQNTPVTISVLSNDNLNGGTGATVSIVNQSLNGTASVVNGQIVFTPNTGFNGTTTFTYQITASNGTSNIATVTVTVPAAVANPPVATNDNATTPQNTPVTINVLSNDNLNGGTGATLSIVSQSLNGTASVVNGQIVFTPITGFSGTTTFTYQITASNGTSNTATVTVVVPQGNTVTDICSDPVGNIIAGSGNITISGITTSAAIIQIFNSSWASVYNQQISTSSVTVPNLPAGTYSVKVSVLNTGGQWPLICEKIIQVTVGGGASNPPVATNDNATTPQNTPVTINVLSNDNLNGGSNATLSIVTQSPNGTASVVNGQIVFTPNTGFTGTTTFTYQITASNGTSNIAAVTVTVPAAVANPPVANNDNATTPQNTPVTINVLSNDNLNGGTGATVSIVSQSPNGTASVVNGQIVFTPNAGFSGTTTLTYQITASNGTSNIAAVTVTVPGTVVNPPVATNDNATTPQNTPVTINVLSNDNLNGGTGATVSIVSQSPNGTASVVNGQIVFTPNAGFTGTTTLTYQITASNGTSNTASVTVVVPQGNTGTDICADPVGNIIAGSGNITISGITTSAAFIQIFNSSWANVYSQQISTSTLTVPNLPAGTYSVKVSVLNTGGQWPVICEKMIQVTVGGGTNPCATDTQVPVLSAMPAAITKTLLTNQTCCVVNWTAPTTTDNCSTPTLTYYIKDAAGTTISLTNGSCFTPGTYTVCYTSTDAAGNKTIGTFPITVNANPCATDTQVPVLSAMPAAITKTLLTNQTCCVVNWTAPTTTDNCSTPTLTYYIKNAVGTPISLTNGSCFTAGSYTVCYTSTDAAGNVTTGTFPITIISTDPCAGETQAPSITNCPTDIVKYLTATQTCCTATWITPLASDNCSTPTLSYSVKNATGNFISLTNGDCFTPGVYTIIYTAIDAAGNKATCSFKLTVNAYDPCLNETQAPIIANCPANISVTATAASPTCMIATWTAPTATDNCSVPTMALTTGLPSGSCFPIGISPIIYKATDANSNTTLCNFSVTVAPPDPCAGDVTAPVFTSCPANISVSTSGACATATWTVPTATDNCGTPTVILLNGLTPGSCFPVGSNLVTYKAKDTKGNFVMCNFNVVVTADPCLGDATAPIFTLCPANISVATKDACAVATWTAPTATDNCGTPTVTLVSTLPSGSCFPVGTNTVIYRATDTKGNFVMCNFNVVVTADPCLGDVTAPVFTSCPANISVTTTAACATASWTVPTATDNCGTPTILLLNGLAPGSCFPVGTNLVTYKAKDAKGNFVMCNFNVVVTQGCMSVSIASTANTACANQSAILTPSVITANKAIEPFTTGCWANETGLPSLSCDNTLFRGIYKMTAAPVGNSCSSNVNFFANLAGSRGNDVYFYIRNDGTGFVKGEFTYNGDNYITYINLTTTTDPGNGTACPNYQTNSVYYLTAAAVSGWHKNCRTGVKTTFSTNEAVHYAYSDATHTKLLLEGWFTIGAGYWFMDKVNPATLPWCTTCTTANMTYKWSNTAATASTTVTTPGTYTVTATDCSGCSASASYTVGDCSNPCANDIQAPVFASCPANINVAAAQGATCANATWAAPTATDNCTNPTVSFATTPTAGLTSGSCFPVGITTVTYTAKDGQANTTTCSFNVIVSPPACSGGLTASYFNNANLSGTPAFTRVDPIIAFNWGSSGPTATSPIDNFSVRWEGQVIAPVTGAYSFVTLSDDAIRVWVNNQLIVDRWAAQPYGVWYAPLINLEGGQRYAIKMEYADYTGTSIAQLEWSYPGQNGAINIPSSALCPTVINSCSPDILVPVLSACPANQTLTTTTTCATATWTAPTATDNCGTPTVTLLTALPSGSCFPVGTNTVTYRAQDASGNSTLCNFNVVVTTPTTCVSSITRTVINSTACGDNTIQFGIWVSNVYYPITNGLFIEYSDLTARFTANSSVLGAISIDLTGRTTVGVPVFTTCTPSSTTDYYYYSNFTGTIGNNSVVSNLSHKFQIGTGANTNNLTSFGGGGWFTGTSYSGDIGILLSGNTATLNQLTCPVATPVAHSQSKSIALEMNASVESRRAKISWINNSGTSNDYFVVQRLNEKTSEFTDVTIVKSNLTEGVHSYTAYDDNPTEGDNYYRVKLVLTNGTEKISNVQKVSFSKNANIALYPNPADDILNVDLLPYRGEAVSIYMYNQFGKQVLVKQVEKVGDTPVLLDINSISTGQYLIRVTSKDKRDATKQVMIVR